MLAVSPLRNTNDEREREMAGFSIGAGEDFLDFSGENLLESIDFDDLFVGMDDGDFLPDLEIDSEILAEFSARSSDESEMNASEKESRKDEEDKLSNASGFNSGLSSNHGEAEVVSKRDESVKISNTPAKEGEKGRKSSANSKNAQGKRKVKVDWTPELHRRFVQAVEQLGVDKAVPSRILEIMGIDCLTRHNIASHLQKYRSHRKHLLAREAEAASWSQRRQMYGAVAGAGGGGGGKRDVSPWLGVAPTMGFPPMTPPPMHPYRPLHVWGHPSVDPSVMHMWPKHLTHSLAAPPPPSQAWAAAPPLPHRPPSTADPSFWHSHHPSVPNSLTPGTPFFPPPLPPTRFPTPAVLPGIPPPPMYRIDAGIGVPTGPTLPRPPVDFHPSKESVDAAIGDVLSKPWLPLPLGLKPPSTDSVMTELHRLGVSKVPPSSA